MCTQALMSNLGQGKFQFQYRALLLTSGVGKLVNLICRTVVLIKNASIISKKYFDASCFFSINF